MTIVEFLTARLDEDEAVAKDATPGPWRWEDSDTDAVVQRPGGESQAFRVSLRTVEEFPTMSVGPLPKFILSHVDYEQESGADAEFIARHDPARVLAEVAAKRQILAAAIEYSPELANGDNGEWAFDTVLRLLALPYSGHPDYQQEWKPLH